MALAFGAIVVGLALLVWSADKFIDGAAATARHAGLSPLIIGMVILGFGTSAPEMMVSAIAALQEKPALALGNALGSNIANMGLILGITALISPIIVDSKILRRELPILLVFTVAAGALLQDYHVSRWEGGLLLLGFAGFMVWSVRAGLRGRDDDLGREMENELSREALMPMSKALLFLGVGLVSLLISSRILVWGGVEVAREFGVSELVIGLTIIAIGTSLPELAASVMAVRKNEHDLALGNVIGSNMFNLLAVVGIAASINAINVEPEVAGRDWGLMVLLTLSLFVMGYGFRGQGRINRLEGAALLSVYVGYTGYLLYTVYGII